MPSRLIGALCIVVACVGAIACFMLHATADAASRGGYLRVDLGHGFTSHPHEPLIDMTRLAPGSSTSGVMGVQNGSQAHAALYLSFDDVAEHDGCTAADEPVGQCSGRDAALQKLLRVTVGIGYHEVGPFRDVWSGSMAKLSDSLALGKQLDASSVRWVRMTASLPESAGNSVQSSVVTFGIHLELASQSGTEGLTVGSKHRHAGTSVLASTGVSIGLLLIGAALLVGCGVTLLWSGHTERGKTV